MSKGTRRMQTDADVKKKAVKLVIVHLKKKISKDFIGAENVKAWVEEMEEILAKPDFDITEYITMRKKLNDIIERVMEEEIRYKLRDSWYSMGKALDKKAKMY